MASKLNIMQKGCKTFPISCVDSWATISRSATGISFKEFLYDNKGGY